jgi:predicted house-cleaning noncanonical NTP pyrophosphatase (MazG superfamily)
MRQFRLDKLVRDDLVDWMQDNGQQVEFRVLEGDDYLQALKDKLVEEVAEFDPSKPTALNELADLKEVLEQTTRALGATLEDLQEAQRAKAEKSGAFMKGLFVETVTMQDDDPWAKYYAAEPERFTELDIKSTE